VRASLLKNRSVEATRTPTRLPAMDRPRLTDQTSTRNASRGGGLRGYEAARLRGCEATRRRGHWWPRSAPCAPRLEVRHVVLGAADTRGPAAGVSQQRQHRVGRHGGGAL